MNLIYGDTNAQIISRMGSNCKRYRIAAKLTQQELADNAGVGIATVKNFENGKLRNVTLESLLRIMRAIGILEQIEGVLPELLVSPFEMEVFFACSCSSILLPALMVMAFDDT